MPEVLAGREDLLNGLYPHRGQADRTSLKRPGVEPLLPPAGFFLPLLERELRRNESPAALAGAALSENWDDAYANSAQEIGSSQVLGAAPTHALVTPWRQA
jgi:hypothetical protein